MRLKQSEKCCKTVIALRWCVDNRTGRCTFLDPALFEEHPQRINSCRKWNKT
jgi:hypothetical protein